MLTAFAAGSGAEITERLELVPGRPAVLYGVDKTTLPLWREIERTRHPYFYIDNGYFRSKWEGGEHYRITFGAPQCSGFGSSSGDRWKSLERKIHPWSRAGSHILIACQSDFWHERHGSQSAIAFADEVSADLREVTDRAIVVRQKPLKDRTEPPLGQALENCWAVVTHSSMVALEAILTGIPAFVLAPSALGPVSSDDIGAIESPYYPDDRLRWASVLAENQWSLEEIRAGTAWRALNGMG